MRRMIYAGPALTVFGLLGLAFLAGRSSAPAEVTYRTVEVPKVEIVAHEKVDTIVQFREKLVYRTAPAITVATAAGGAQPDVERFCGPASADSAGNAEPARGSPALLLRSVRTEPGWFFGADRVILTGPLSTADLRQLEYSARPGWRVHVHADTAVFQSPRTWWIRELLEAAAYAGAGYVAGRLTP